MTVSSETNRVSYSGNGSTVTFAVPFYFLANADLVVKRVVSATGVETTLALTTDYTVTGAGDEAGGEVTLLAAPTALQEVVIYRDPTPTQLTDYGSNDKFPAASHERALDKLTMIAQRTRELVERSFRLPDGYTGGASTQIPTPDADTFLAWDEEGLALINVTVADLLTIATAGNFVVDKFSGDGAETEFTLSSNPGTINNIRVFIAGVHQTPDTDYSLSGTALTFSTAPPSGTDNVLVAYATVLSSITTPADTTVTRAKLSAAMSAAISLSAKEYLAVGDGVTDDTVALQNWINACGSTKIAHLPDGDYKFTALTIAGDMTFAGNGRLVGTATSGSKPTRADLTGAANSAARLALLDAYYTADITFSATSIIRGTLSIKDCLLKKSGGAGVDNRGDLTFNNVSTHAMQVEVSRKGFLAATGFISSDSSSVGLFAEHGGRAVAQSSIIVYPSNRGLYVYDGGSIDATSSEVWNAGSNGLYVAYSGSIICSSGRIAFSTGAGVIINYGGSINVDGATIEDSTGAGVVAEGGGAIYAFGATIDDNGDVGIGTSFGGVVTAENATITNNTSYAAYANGSGYIYLKGATVDLTNNGGGSNQIVRALGTGTIYSEEPGVGSGKTALASANYSPSYNSVGNGKAYIGIYSQDDSLVRAPGIALGVNKAPSTATISSDDITIGRSSWYRVDTEAAAATDNLDTIIGGEVGQIIILQTTNSGRDVTVNNNAAGAGSSILLVGGVSFTLSNVRDSLTLQKDVDGFWVERARSDVV